MGMFNFQGLRRLIKGMVNRYNQATFSWHGNEATHYDPNQKNYIREGYNINPDVFSIINQQATKTANIPFYIKTVDDKEAQKNLNTLHKSTNYNLTPQQLIKSLKLTKKAFKEEIKPFPLERPNPNQTWAEILALYKTYLASTGNVYFYLLAPESGQDKGKPIQVYLLPSHLVQIVIRQDADMLTIENPIDHYLLIEGNTYVEFEEKDIIHVKLPNPNFGMDGEHLYGQSRLRAALKNIQSTNLGLNQNINTMNNGGVYGFIHGKGTPLTEPQATALKERLVEMDKSAKRLSNIAGSSAELAFTRLSLTSDELKIFEYLEYDQKQICNVLIWDIRLLNDVQGAKYDNMNIVRKRAITDNIIPDLKLLSEVFNSKFLTRYDDYENCVLIFDASELPEMQQDMKTLSEWLYGAIDKGIITRDEARQIMNFEQLNLPETTALTVSTQTILLEDSLIPGGEFVLDEQGEV